MVGLRMYVFISNTLCRRVAPRFNPSWHLTRRERGNENRVARRVRSFVVKNNLSAMNEKVDILPILRETQEDFPLSRIVIPVFEKAVAKFGRRCPEAYYLSAHTVNRRLDEIEDIVTGDDIRKQI